MNTEFFKNIYSHPLIGESEMNKIIAGHQLIKFSKGTLFLESGKLANDYFLIKEGLLRAFILDYNGNEITTDFHGTNEIAIEVSSLFQRIPTEETIIALTDGIAWKIDFNTFQELFDKIQGFREWGRAWMSQQLFLSKQRFTEMYTKTASERYLQLIKANPQIVQQAPIKHIASYLGITDTSLSRIRRELAHD